MQNCDNEEHTFEIISAETITRNQVDGKPSLGVVLRCQKCGLVKEQAVVAQS